MKKPLKPRRPVMFEKPVPPSPTTEVEVELGTLHTGEAVSAIGFTENIDALVRMAHNIDNVRVCVSGNTFRVYELITVPNEQYVSETEEYEDDLKHYVQMKLRYEAALLDYKNKMLAYRDKLDTYRKYEQLRVNTEITALYREDT